MITVILCIVLGIMLVVFVYAMGMRRRRARRQVATASAIIFGIASTLLGLYLSGVIWQPEQAQDTQPKVTATWVTYAKQASKADLTCAQKVLNITPKRASQLAATVKKGKEGDDLRGIVKLNKKGLTNGQAKAALAQFKPPVDGLYSETVTAIYYYSGKHCTEKVFASPGAYLTLTIPSKDGKTFVRNKGIMVMGNKYYPWKAVSAP